MFEEDDNEELTIPETDGEKIARLKDKIIELQSMCRAIEMPLIGAGFLNKPSNDVKANVSQPGIRINGKLSFRGIQKAEEFYDKIREKKEVPFGYADFRAMCSLSEPLGVVHATETINWEAWQMSMADNGITTDHKGYMSQSEFLRYRKLIETRNKPLLPELHALDLKVLPKIQQQWALARTLIDEVIAHRTNNNGMKNVITTAKLSLAEEQLDVDEVLFVLANCGITFAKSEYFRTTVERARFDVLMGTLLSKSLKKNYGQSPQRYAKLLLDQHEHQIYVQVRAAQKREAEKKRLKMERLQEKKRQAKALKNGVVAGGVAAVAMRKKEEEEKKKAEEASQAAAKKKKKKREVVPDITYKDMNSIAPYKLIAWMFGRRPTPTYPDAYQALLQFKYTAWRWIRKTELFFYHISLFGAHVKQRKLFLDMKQEVLAATGQGGASAAAKAVASKAIAKKPAPAAAAAAPAAAVKKVDAVAEAKEKLAKLEKNPHAEEEEEDESSLNTVQKEENAMLEEHPYRRLPAKKFHKTYKDRKDIRGSFDCSVEVGKSASSEEGTAISFKLSRLDKPELHFVKQKLPREVTSAFIIDLQIRAGMDTNTINRTAVALKILISNHFFAELQHHPLFRGLFVYPIESEHDSSMVLRVAFVYKKMSIDSYLEQAYIPFSLCDLIGEFRGELKTNVHVLDVISNNSASLDNLFTGKFDLFMNFRRELILSILQRLQLAFSATAPETLLKAMVESEQNQSQQHKEYMKYIKIKQEEQRKASTGDVPPIPSSKKAADDFDFEFHFADQWKDIRPYFPMVADAATAVMERIRGVKNSTVVFKFNYLSDMLNRVGMFSPTFKWLFPTEFARSHRFVTATFQKWTKYCTSNINAVFEYCKAFLEDRVAQEEIARRKALLQTNGKKRPKTADSEDSSDEEGGTEDENAAEGGDNSQKVMERLQRMGIQAAGDELFEGDEAKPEPSIKRLEDKIIENDIQALQTLERLWKCCLGIHTVELISGKARLVFGCQGLDLMELFPEPPSILQVKIDCEEKRKASTAKGKERRLSAAARNAGATFSGADD